MKKLTTGQIKALLEACEAYSRDYSRGRTATLEAAIEKLRDGLTWRKKHDDRRTRREKERSNE